MSRDEAEHQRRQLGFGSCSGAFVVNNLLLLGVVGGVLAADGATATAIIVFTVIAIDIVWVSAATCGNSAPLPFTAIIAGTSTAAGLLATAIGVLLTSDSGAAFASRAGGWIIFTMLLFEFLIVAVMTARVAWVASDVWRRSAVRTRTLAIAPSDMSADDDADAPAPTTTGV